MAVVGTKHFGDRGERIVYVDADPALTSVNAPKGSLIVFLGTPVQFFTKDDDGDTTNVTEVGAGGGGGARTFVSATEVTGSPAATVDITGLDSTSSSWEIDAFIEATADGAVQALLGLSAAFKAAGYKYHSHRGQDNSATYLAVAAGADGQFVLVGLLAESTTERPWKCTFKIYNPAATDRRKICEWQGVMYGNSQRANPFWGGGGQDVDNTAFDTVRFRIAGTTIAVGSKFFLYKMAEA